MMYIKEELFTKTNENYDISVCGGGVAGIAVSLAAARQGKKVILFEKLYMLGGLAPRCRLIASWGCSRSQGLGCSPIKAVRELGSERRETVRSLSIAGAGNLKGADPSTRGPGWTDRW